MNKLLCIVGPTSTGKTAKAVQLAGEGNTLLVSADSRQVYRGMDLVTGKDQPPNIPLIGLDLVDPDEDCSVSLWYDAVMPAIRRAWDQGQQVIVVGGTGLYVQALTDGIATIQVPPDQSLRTKLAKLTLSELQNRLLQLAPVKYKSLNNSDLNNPRRLIRAIEIAVSNVPPATFVRPHSTLIGLYDSSPTHYRRLITARVKSRILSGAVEETKQLLSRYSPLLPSMTALGYRSLIKYLAGGLTSDDLITHWVNDELSYAKRQLTWFRKNKSIEWYDISK